MREALEALFFMFVIVYSVVMSVFGFYGIDHAGDGTKAHRCFANMTCRADLKCVAFDGLQPTCIAEGKR